MDGALNNIFNAIQERYEELVNNCFLQCGYSEEYVKKHPEEFEIIVSKNHDFNDIKKFYYKILRNEKVTMIELFSIETDYSGKLDFAFVEDYRISFRARVYRGAFNGS